jgi:inosine-uridine nucleoside N-ribohydrolase
MSDIARAFSFTAVANDTIDVLGNTVDLTVSGTFVGTVALQRQMSGQATWDTVAASVLSAPGSLTVTSASPCKWRLTCSAFTSGTIVCLVSAATRS